MKKLKEENAITLVALVITIVVLLILAGVSINLVLGENGLITKAKEASEKTKNMDTKEKIELSVASAKMKSADFENITKENLQETLTDEMPNKTISIVEDEDAWLVTVDNTEKYWVSKNGKVTDGSYLYNNVVVGDYVEYNAGTGFKYTTLKENNGYENKTFSSNNSIKWKVLTKKNGNVYLISDDLIKADDATDLIFSGKTGYLKGINELNNICSIYGHGNGAEKGINLTAEDVMQLVCDLENYTEKVAIAKTSIYAEGTDFFDRQGNPVEEIERDYQYYCSSYRAMDSTKKEYKIIFQTDKTVENETSGFWLATQTVNINSKGCWYGILETYFSENKYRINGRHFYKADTTYVDRASSIRPVVILKSDAKITGKNENGEWIIQ